MRRLGAAFALLLLGAVACSHASDTSFPLPAPHVTRPPAITAPVPPAPRFAVPAQPAAARRTTASTTHAPFFSGEASLANGVYYLALPNGTPFGYYAYLTDTSYVYHFDLGYEYVIDANDGKRGAYPV